MKNLLITALLLTLNLSILTAQKRSDKVEMKWGPELKESKTLTLNDVIGHDETGIYVLKYDRKEKLKNSIAHYDNNMVKTHSQGINLEVGKNDHGLKYVIHFNQKLFLFTDYFDKKLDLNSFYVQELDKKSLTPIGKKQRIAQFKFEGKKKKLGADFNLRISRDDSKILIYTTIPPTEKYANEKFDITVLDGEMNKLWDKQIVAPYRSDLWTTGNVKVDNDGNAHIFGKLFKSKEDRERKGVNYHFEILSYLDNGSRIKKYPVKIEGKYLMDMQITVDDNRDIVCGGFYSKTSYNSVDGSYFLKINAESESITSRSFEEFDIDFITQNMTEKEERKTKKKEAKGKDAELYAFNLDEIVLREDGGALLVGEQYYVIINYNTDANGNTTTSYTYHYNDIIVININPEGQIEWTEKIAKRQASTNDGGFYSSYVLGINEDKLHFIFNDHPKNLFYNGSGKVYNMKRGKDAVVVMVTMDSNGAQERETLFRKEEVEILTRPKVCEQISDDRMIIYGRTKKTQRFANLRFKD